EYEGCRALVEFLVDHDVVQRSLDRKKLDERAAWIKEHIRERRADNPQISWEDMEAEYDRLFPRERSPIEVIHDEFSAKVPHPQLHGGKQQKNVWQQMEDAELGFLDFVDRNHLAHEEGSLFSYLIRVMNFAHTLQEATGLDQFASLRQRVRRVLSSVDARLIDDLDRG
ncbi:MAG TPA: hypothetical protein VL172_15290, partial [Kofleriaceae bacterium]|nr:hypothetical protein [Kofleriaceae bacterium]